MKTTEDLLKSLSLPDISIDDFMIQNHSELRDCDIPAAWQELLCRSQMKNSEIIARSDFESVYFYEIISGKKKPSRDKLIRLCIGMQATLSDCQYLLRIYTYSPLYPRIRRDCYLIYCFVNHLTVKEACELLEKNAEDRLK